MALRLLPEAAAQMLLDRRVLPAVEAAEAAIVAPEGEAVVIAALVAAVEAAIAGEAAVEATVAVEAVEVEGASAALAAPMALAADLAPATATCRGAKYALFVWIRSRRLTTKTSLDFGSTSRSGLRSSRAARPAPAPATSERSGMPSSAPATWPFCPTSDLILDSKEKRKT
jgi:hypothetical protein